MRQACVRPKIPQRLKIPISCAFLTNTSRPCLLLTMSSGFVSGGTTDAPIERSDEWLAAQVELEANRRRKADEAAAQNSGRSLFETLEANKGFFALIAQPLPLFANYIESPEC